MEKHSTSETILLKAMTKMLKTLPFLVPQPNKNKLLRPLPVFCAHQQKRTIHELIENKDDVKTDKDNDNSNRETVLGDRCRLRRDVSMVRMTDIEQVNSDIVNRYNRNTMGIGIKTIQPDFGRKTDNLNKHGFGDIKNRDELTVNKITNGILNNKPNMSENVKNFGPTSFDNTLSKVLVLNSKTQSRQSVKVRRKIISIDPLIQKERENEKRLTHIQSLIKMPETIRKSDYMTLLTENMDLKRKCANHDKVTKFILKNGFIKEKNFLTSKNIISSENMYNVTVEKENRISACERPSNEGKSQSSTLLCALVSEFADAKGNFPFDCLDNNESVNTSVNNYKGWKTTDRSLNKHLNDHNAWRDRLSGFMKGKRLQQPSKIIQAHMIPPDDSHNHDNSILEKQETDKNNLINLKENLTNMAQNSQENSKCKKIVHGTLNSVIFSPDESTTTKDNTDSTEQEDLEWCIPDHCHNEDINELGVFNFTFSNFPELK